MTSHKEIPIAVMIGGIEPPRVEEMTIGELDQGAEKGIVEVHVTVDLLLRIRHPVVKPQQTAKRENGKPSANVNICVILQAV